MKHHPDIDLDFADRDKALALFKHNPATIIKNGIAKKHNTGVYVTDIPMNPLTGSSTLDHKVADDRFYSKLDFLNLHVYDLVKDEQHLDLLTKTEPPWEKLLQREFCEQVIHINDSYNTIMTMKPDSIPRMAMFLSIMRPAKRHLIGSSWAEIGETVWVKPDNDLYFFKHAHAVSYALLVQVHMNLINGV